MNKAAFKRPFDLILNFRDVGQFVNQHGASSQLQEGRLYRSARPDHASLQDRRVLVEGYRIVSIIDLRSKTEHIRKAIDKAAGEALKMAQIQYHEINLNGGAFERALLWKLNWSSLTKFISLMVTGYRTEAIGILGREVMQPRGLVGLGIDSIDACGSELRQIFEVLADSRNYPIMVHCTQGKDRTGLVIILVLLMLGIPLDAIVADYMASEDELKPELQSRIKELGEIGLMEDFTSCPRTFVAEMYEYINKEYGSTQGYLQRIGVHEAMQQSIRDNMMG
ncbi:hypothetical protein MMC12_007998 [Toensbergia leucococca]|nr:hypothetical protein [Toensbergia leucococca]